MAQAVRSATRIARMRILAIPLTPQSRLTGEHTYYHFQTPPPAEDKGKPSLAKRAAGKAAEIWASFGKAPQGTWKHRTFSYGERVMDRIDFEELALKSMDPSLGPKAAQFGQPVVEIKEGEDAKIPLIFPTFFARETSPLQHLQALLQKRTPAHRKGFYFWMLISPLTAPFMLIPIIPNLPFFFCVWRSWHHYRAFKASSYLENLIKHGMVNSEPNTDLDRIYDEHSSFTGSRREKSLESDKPEMLNREAVPQIVALFELTSSAEADLLRALGQTEIRLSKTQDSR